MKPEEITDDMVRRLCSEIYGVTRPVFMEHARQSLKAALCDDIRPKLIWGSWEWAEKMASAMVDRHRQVRGVNGAAPPAPNPLDNPDLGIR